jgi:CheY-like chemotaxis protein
VACILYVGDDQDRSKSAGRALRAYGYNTLTAMSGVQAIALSLQNSVDFVVLDYEMPGMNGDLVAQAIRRYKPSLPIILFTGMPDGIPDGVRQNVNRVVYKPDFSGLLAAIEELVTKKPGKPEAI